MAENPFLTSPFAPPAVARQPAETPAVDDQFVEAAPAKVQAPARRGMVPTRDDVARRASELGVDPRLALAIFNQESGGNFNSKDSPRNARGGFQVVPGTYKAMMGTDAGQRDAWNNMEAGLRYLAHGKKVLGTDDPVLLASGYHAGYERKDLKAGRIPGTNDGMISTADYARSVAARVRGSRQPASQQPNLADQFTDTPEAAVSPAASDFVDTLEEARGPVIAGDSLGDWGKEAADQQKAIDNRPYLDRLTEETKAGFGDMTRSLTTARWALGGGDASALAEELAQSFQEQAKKPKTTAQKEIDAAYKGVSDAKGVIDTTAAGAKALWASLTNPKETSIEIARNAANSLPTLGAGAAGAAAGGAVGSVVPVAGTLTGAIVGGRAGMAAGTTATELGAEIQDMVQKRLETAKHPPTAQNVLAILSDKDFQSQALKQGAAKGLTVAAVDQLFMGLGGKIATAPARKIASKELAEQGMDMATRAGRKAALASPAGQAAIAAAKPTLGARARAGAAAVGVDAVGESLGEGLSQQVARGEVDYGDALREGVVSIGQSAAQTAVGATIESAKVAARAAKGAMQPTAAAPSTASGPLARATENAAAEPERVTVTAPDGQVSGTVTGQTPGGVQVVGDDGQVYHFATGPNGVQITPEAPNTPLSNAVEVAAGEVAVEPPAEAPQAPAVSAEAPLPTEQKSAVDLIRAIDAGGVPLNPAKLRAVAEGLGLQVASTDAPEQTIQRIREAVTRIPAPEQTAPAVAAPIKQPKAMADMTEPELRERLKYIKQQAKPANGGWNKMLVEQRKLVEREIDARTEQAKAGQLPQAQAPAQPTTLGTQVNVEAGPGFTAETMGLSKPAAQFAETKAEALAEPAKPAAAEPMTKERWVKAILDQNRLAGDTGVQLSVAPNGKLTFMGDPRANKPGRALQATLEEARKAGATDKEIAAAIQSAKKPAAPVTQPATPVETTEEGAGASQPPQAAPDIAALQKEVDEARAAWNESHAEPVRQRFQAARAALEAATKPVEAVAEAEQKPAKPKTASKEDLDHLFGVDKKRAAALDRVAKGTAFFGDKAKAQAFITKNGLADTHTVEQTGKVRFDVKPKEQANAPALAKKPKQEAMPRQDFVSKAGVGKISAVKERYSNKYGVSWASTDITSADTMEEAAAIAKAVAESDADTIIAMREVAKKAKEQPNVADQRPQQQPAGAEAVGQEANAGQAAPAAVQPDAAQEEVTPVLADKLVKKAEANEAKADRIEAAGGDAQQVESLREQAERDRVTAKQPKPVTVTKAGAGATAIIIDPSATTLAGRVRQARAESKAEQAERPKEKYDHGDFGFMTATEAQAKHARFLQAAREARQRAKDAPTKFIKNLSEESASRSTIAARQLKTEINSRMRQFPDYREEVEADAVATDVSKPASEIDTTAKPVEAPAKSDPFANNTLFTSDAVAKARARLKSKLNQLNSGFDPELAMDGMVIAGAYIESGVRKFSDYAKLMIDDLGPKVTPFLLSFYEAARNYPGLDTAGMTPVADAKSAFEALNAKPEPVTTEKSKPAAGAPVQAESMDAFESALKAGEKVHYDYAGTDGSTVWIDGSTVWIEPSGRGTGWVVKQKNDDLPEFTYTTGGNPMAGGYSRDEAVNRAKEIVAYRFNEWKPLAEGNDNGPQELDQPRPRELAGEQPDAVQGTQPQRQAGPGAEGSSSADARGDERAGSAGSEQPGRLGDDAREVPAASTGEGSGRGGEPGRRAVQRGERPAKPDPATGNRDLGNQPELTPESGTRAQDRADGFTITDADAIGEGGAKTKYKQNVAAIRLLKELTAANRQATRAEQAVLAKYVGWGGIPQAFYRDNGEVSKGWEKEAAELKALLTADELAAAASSTRNAHFTSTEIVSAIWTALRHFGFKGGRVLEPSVGVGNFYGLMPAALRSASQLTGVELDHITGGIAKQLYPQANIQAPVGFQDFAAPDNYFDVATGNPPFGPEGIYDAIRRKISGFSIHNYFFAKSIDTVKPNGVLAMVVTNRLLDSMGDKARQYIANRAEFLGAIRLPNDAFLKNAGTQVTTDIIFLRKLKDGEAPTGQSWMDVKQVTDKNGKTVPLNEYFVRNPDMMLGEFGAFGTMYRPDDAALIARPGQDTPALLAAAIAKLPQGFMDGPTAEPTRETVEPLTDISRVKVGSVFEQDGKIFERKEDMLGKQQAKEVTFASDKARERVSGMIQVREALIAVRGLQLTEGVSEKALESARAGLNKAYDSFVKAHGPINADANKRLMRDDPTWPQLAALEDGFDKGISAAVAKTTGEKARPASAKKAAIFFKRTQAPYHAPTKAASAKDALVSSLSERGRVDLDYMAGLYGKTPEAIARELDGLIFEVVPGDYVTREEYLSGNVKKRLALTLQLAEKMPRFQKNVEALRAVQPADIEAVDIDVKTGAHWVPADVMEGFVAHITEGNRIKAVYNPITATWTLDAERISNAAFTKYATDRASIMKVLEAAANQKQIQVFDEDRRAGTRTLNEAATTAANAKVELVKSEWKNWIWADDARRTRLARIYNDTFNTDVAREFDGSHLTFPGKVGDDIITLRPHQKNAVWRVIQSGTTLLDHVVGAGKTMAVIASVMEMRRMGLAKKPMLVVPNHLVGQWAEDFMKLYPGANILAATKKDFEKDNRKKLFARIATGDWDAVIVAHSSFGKVEVEPEFQEQFIKQQIADMDTSISAMRAAEGKSSRNVKQIEKQKAALEEKLKRLFDTGSKDDNLYFSELGVDAVLLDEAHEFKNLGFSTGMQRVAGLGNPIGSNKAADMFMKVQSVLKRTGGRNVVFATGTPISNTMAEMYTMQRYLDYGTLKDQGIAHFDAWAKTFGEVVTDWELSPSGQYKMNSRFAKFVNMPELMQRYGSFADVINRDDINRQLAAQGKKLPVPKLKGGKPENTVVERSQDQARYIGIPTVDENGVESYLQGSLIWRSENLPKKAEKGADNMLKIMSDARKAALDMRLIDPNYPDNPGSKVNVAAGNIKAIYDKWTADKGTQLVFIDLSTPKGAVAKEAAALRELVSLAEQGDEAAQEKLDAMSPDELLALDSSFSVYDDLKAKLLGLGIPENEVAFIHDANTELQKEELFAKVRTGRVRVLFGSTAKMGAGMNVQDRLVALHHLDAPWRPSDLEQREGRIIRQGNKLYEADPENFEVEIKRYATKQTLDSRMWQTIEAKARFIEQVRKGTGQREVEDVAGEAANSAEMKAASSGNPLILEEMSLRQAIRKLENGQSEHNREQFRIKDQMRWVSESAKRADAEAAIMEADAPKAPKAFAVTIGNQTFDKHGEAGEAILAAVDAMHAAGEESRDIGSYGRFALTVDDTTLAGTKKAVLTIKGQGEYQIEANPGSATTGLALRLQNTVKGLAESAASSRAKAERYRADAPKLEAQIKPWGQEQELAEAKARHAAVIDQLKPKKKPADETPAMSRAELEPIFEALEGRGLARKRALDSLANLPEAARIQYIENNFFDILGELEDSNLVDIKC